MKKGLVLGVALCLLLSTNAYAKNVWEMAESPKYGTKAAGMFGRGLLNAASCFVDIPVATVEGAKQNEPQIFGAVGGFAQGSVCTILRAASGIIDVATFWVPGFNGLPVCKQYGNCLACYSKKEQAPVMQYAPVTPMPQQPMPSQQVVYPEEREVTRTAATESGRMKYIKK